MSSDSNASSGRVSTTKDVIAEGVVEGNTSEDDSVAASSPGSEMSQHVSNTENLTHEPFDSSHCSHDSSDETMHSDSDILDAVTKELRELRSGQEEHEKLFQRTSEHLRSLQKEKSCDLLHLIRNDDELNAFCGIRTALLDSLTECVKSHEGENKRNACSVKSRVAMTLCKLRLNLSFICLSVLFRLNARTCSRYVHFTIVSLAAVLRGGIQWPSKEETLSHMPKCFKSYSNTRIVLDCTEVPIERPKCLHCRLLTYSHYKGRQTIKFLIGISPAGWITYLSLPFGGRASDKAIFAYSDILEKLESGLDAIMVDKGFMIEDECASSFIQLIRPPFKGKRKQFSPAEVDETKKIAAARIHVERAIQRIKIFQVLSGPVPWRTVPYMGMIMNIIGAIVNLTSPILSNERFGMLNE